MPTPLAQAGTPSPSCAGLVAIRPGIRNESRPDAAEAAHPGGDVVLSAGGPASSMMSAAAAAMSAARWSEVCRG